METPLLRRGSEPKVPFLESLVRRDSMKLSKKRITKNMISGPSTFAPHVQGCSVDDYSLLHNTFDIQEPRIWHPELTLRDLKLEGELI